MSNIDAPWEGDVNDTVLEEWKAETTPFDPVKEVLLAMTTPQYAGVSPSGHALASRALAPKGSICPG